MGCHFILGVFNYYVQYTVLLRWDKDKVVGRLAGMGRFKGGFKCRGRSAV